MIVRIKSVNHDGYCGREHHPSDSDIGLLVVVESIWREVFEGLKPRTVLPTNLAKLELDAFSDHYSVRKNDDDPYVETCFSCRTYDGRPLDLMWFEIEFVSF